MSADAATALGLTLAHDPAPARIVVISHDCDIVNDDARVEGTVEVIVGHSVPPEKADGNLFWGKSTRGKRLAKSSRGPALDFG